MRHLLASTCLAALAIAPLHAETTVTDKRTVPLRTATIKAGAPDDIRITSTGTVELAAPGAAVTLDSPNSVVNEGTIQISNQNDSAGIRAQSGQLGNITNAASGKIVIDETYTAADADNDGDLDGPLAVGSGRFGIQTVGIFNGNVTNNGAITIEGQDSAGIQTGSLLDGKLVSDGAIVVTGDRSAGIRIGNVTGGVQTAAVGQPVTAIRIAGSVTATGKDAVGVSLEGDVNGALVIQGAVSATGYRSSTVPADTSKLDADDLLQGGPAVRIAGSVAQGVIFAVPPKDNSTTDNDEDKDGIDDAKEGSAAITSAGSAAAVEIGSATRALTLGPVTGNADGHGLVNEGTIVGAGLYPGVASNGVVIALPYGDCDTAKEGARIFADKWKNAAGRDGQTGAQRTGREPAVTVHQAREACVALLSLMGAPDAGQGNPVLRYITGAIWQRDFKALQGG